MGRPVNLASIHATALRCQKEGVGLSECAIRRLVKSGDIPSVQIGSKALVHWDNLLVFVEQGNSAAPAPRHETIRPIIV